MAFVTARRQSGKELKARVVVSSAASVWIYCAVGAFLLVAACSSLQLLRMIAVSTSYILVVCCFSVFLVFAVVVRAVMRSVPNQGRFTIFADYLTAYMWSLFVATVVYSVQAGIVAWLDGWEGSQPMLDRVLQVVATSLLPAFVFFPFYFFWLAMIPFVLWVGIARFLRIRSVTYYAVSGLVSAIAVSPVAAWLLPYDDTTDFPPSFVDRCVFRAATSIAPAVAAGVAYWMWHGRKQRTA